MKSSGNIIIVCLLVSFLSIILYFKMMRPPPREQGTFRPEARSLIESNLQNICEKISDASLGQCAPIHWEGKHRWFGRVAIQPSLDQLPSGRFHEIVTVLGWSWWRHSGDVTEYRRQDLELSFYEREGLIKEFTVTTDR